MRSRRESFLVMAGLITIFFVSSCVTFKSAGVFTAPGPGNKLISLSELEARPSKYHIYYVGLSWDMPTALLFDPKGDDRKIIGQSWVKVQEGHDLHRMINFVKSFTNFDPRLYAIIGPGGQVFGYILAPTFAIQTRIVDEKTIISKIESPLYLDDGHFFTSIITN